MIKKLALTLFLLASSLSLVACSPDTRIAKDLEYVETIQTEKSHTVIFKDRVGDIVGFNIDRHKGERLTKGRKYDVEYTISDAFNYGDYIVDTQLTEEN